MKHNFHLIKGSTNIPVSMATSTLVHKTGQGPFFALMASGKAWLVTLQLHPPSSILATGNGPWLVLLLALCLVIMWKCDDVGQKCAREVANN